LAIPAEDPPCQPLPETCPAISGGAFLAKGKPALD
jgi:hypothetical protein